MDYDMFPNLYLVEVKEHMKELYFPSWLHSGIGYIWQEDDEHIWFKFFKDTPTGPSGTARVPYISSPCRYCRDDIDYRPVQTVWTLY